MRKITKREWTAYLDAIDQSHLTEEQKWGMYLLDINAKMKLPLYVLRAVYLRDEHQMDAAEVAAFFRTSEENVSEWFERYAKRAVRLGMRSNIEPVKESEIPF